VHSHKHGQVRYSPGNSRQLVNQCNLPTIPNRCDCSYESFWWKISKLLASIVVQNLLHSASHCYSNGGELYNYRLMNSGTFFDATAGTVFSYSQWNCCCLREPITFQYYGELKYWIPTLPICKQRYNCKRQFISVPRQSRNYKCNLHLTEQVISL